MIDETLNHTEATPATNTLRMHRRDEDATLTLLRCEMKIVTPHLFKLAGWYMTWEESNNRFQCDEIIQRPMARQFYQIDYLTKLVRFIRTEAVSSTDVIRNEVASKQARVVLETISLQQTKRAVAEIPRGRSISDWPHPSRAV